MAAQDNSAPIHLFTAQPAPTERIGGYEIIGEIARGGMGTVYLCRRVGEAGFQRLFAVKLMHEHLAEDERFIGMLLDEARLAARIHHHNVVAIVDLGVDHAGHFVVMEYIEGCSLSQMLKKSGGPPPARLAVPLMIDALAGLHAAHTVPDDFGRPMNLVHRDVSPQNILVGLDGVARITDFGIATARSRITATRPGVHKGKLAYSAPEQLDGTRDIDARVDVFAAGAVLWSLLTGRRLFRGRTDAETLNNLLHRPVPPPSKINPGVPDGFDEVCLRALQRDRGLRYPSAASMAEAVSQVAEAENCLGKPAEISDWVSYSFADELDARRAVIRQVQPGVQRSPTALPGPQPPGTNPSSTFATRSTFRAASEDPSIHIGLRGQALLQRTWVRIALVAAAASLLAVIAVSRLGGSSDAPQPAASPTAPSAPAPPPVATEKDKDRQRAEPTAKPEPPPVAKPEPVEPSATKTPAVDVAEKPVAAPKRPRRRIRRAIRHAPRRHVRPHRRPAPVKHKPAPPPPPPSTANTDNNTAQPEPKVPARKPRNRPRGDEDPLSPRLEENPYLRN